MRSIPKWLIKQVADGNNNKSDLGILSFPIRHVQVYHGGVTRKMQCGGQYFSRSEKFVAFKEALRSYSKHQQQLLKKAPLS